MADETLSRDQNHITVLGGVTDDSNQFIKMLRVDPTTKRLLVSATGLPGSGTVTSVSVTSANGFAGTVATATTTPAITISTTINSPVLAGNGTAISAATTTGSTSTVVLQTSPTLITPVLGVATATSINGLTITSSTGTFTLTNGKTFAVTHSLTLSGTDSTIMTFPTTSATIARTDAANTFTGTQTIGALVATTINGNTFTTGTGVLTIAAVKTLTVSNTLTLAGTDGKGINVGAATSGKILIGDGSNMILSTPTYPTTAGSSGNVLTSDGTNWGSAAPSSGSFTSAVRVSQGTGQSITGGGGDTLVNFDTEQYDGLNEFNTGTHLFTATATGKYIVMVQILTSTATDTNLYKMIIYVNGSEYSSGRTRASGTGGQGIVVFDIVPVTAAQTIGVYANFQATADVSAGASNSYLSIHRIE